MDKFFIEYKDKPVIYTEIPWHFKSADKKDLDVNMKLVKSEDGREEGLLFLLQSYENEAGSIRAARLHLRCEENTVFIADLIKSDEDICVYTDFAAYNNDFSISCNVADKNKLVIRSKECGIKHFRLFSELDGNSVTDKTGLMMPYRIKECGDVVYSMYEGLYSYGKEHRMCFGFCSDTADKIPWWHFHKTDRGYMAEPPSKVGGWEIEFESNYVKIYNSSGCKNVFNLNKNERCEFNDSKFN